MYGPLAMYITYYMHHVLKLANVRSFSNEPGLKLANVHHVLKLANVQSFSNEPGLKLAKKLEERL